MFRFVDFSVNCLLFAVSSLKVGTDRDDYLSLSLPLVAISIRVIIDNY